MKTLQVTITALILFIGSSIAFSQEVPLDTLLERNIANIPALNEKVNISVSNSSIQEFMRGVANNTGLNINVDPNMDIRIVNNFSNVRVLDMLVFLAKEYKLKIGLIGNIVTVTRENIPVVPNVTINYDNTTKTISISADNEDFYTVSRLITEKTGLNVIAQLNARNEKVSCYIKDMPFDAAIEKLATSNGMTMTRTNDGFYIIDKPAEVVQQTYQGDYNQQRSNRNQGNNNQRRGNQSGDSEYFLEIKKIMDDSVTIKAVNAPVNDVLQELSEKMGFSYFISPGAEDAVTGSIGSRNPDLILTYLLNGTKIAHKKVDNVYIIGEKKMLDYNEHKVIPLQNRSIDKLAESIPKDIKEGLEIVEFPELNSFFVSGPAYQILGFESFVKQIDKVVPVVLIEVIIFYENKTKDIETGLNAGLGKEPISTGGTLYPGIDISIGSKELNKIISGGGLINLGNVTPNFYLNLKALETQGFIEMESTPKLSTLNGHEASLAIGKTAYYQEDRSDIIGNQSPIQTFTTVYKSVDAELKLKIKPIVSGDDQITLEIEVSQSDFTDRIEKTAPPGTINRKFNSQIRVKNQDMILLGGLLEKRSEDNGSGTPILSRIPVIKWIFSSRSKKSLDSKLNILIRPTIIN